MEEKRKKLELKDKRDLGVRVKRKKGLRGEDGKKQVADLGTKASRIGTYPFFKFE